MKPHSTFTPCPKTALYSKGPKSALWLLTGAFEMSLSIRVAKLEGKPIDADGRLCLHMGKT